MILDKTFGEWINQHVSELYFGHKDHGFPVFHTKNGGHHKNRRPDWIFKTNKGAWGCIEYEPGDKYGDITTGATQLSDIHYCLEEGMYFEVDGKKINPQWFFLATKYSEKGYLWKNDVRVSVKYGDEMSGVREKNSTVFHAIRWMWRFCGRDSRMCSDSNPVGVTQFSVIYGIDKVPWVEIDGQKTVRLRDL